MSHMGATGMPLVRNRDGSEFLRPAVYFTGMKIIHILPYIGAPYRRAWWTLNSENSLRTLCYGLKIPAASEERELQLISELRAALY